MDGAAYSLCLFDLDGTLTDPGEGITKSVHHALASFGVEVASLAELTPFIGPPLRDSFRERYGFSAAEAEEAVGRYREYFAETGIYENALYPDVPDVLARLRAAGMTLAVATSKPTVYARRIVEHFGLSPYFAYIAGSELDGTRSEKAQVIDYALETVDPGRRMPCAMVGDRKHDIIGARAMNMDGVGVMWGYGSRAELEEAGAAWLAETPEALAEELLKHA